MLSSLIHTSKILLILLLISSSLGAQSIEEFTLKTDKGELVGTLLSPSADKIPLAIIIAGSGPTDRNGNNSMMTNNSLKMLAEGLLSQDIATLRFDKRGIGASKEAGIDESELRFDQMVEDVAAWIDTLSKDSRFSNITVIGHSEGSTIGMIASQSKQVSKYISIAGPGERASDKIKEQLVIQAPAIVEMTNPILEKLNNGETVDSIPPMLYSLFRPSVQPYLISWFRYDPKKEIAKLDKPILIIQGTTDIQVSLSDADQLSKSNRRSEKFIIEGMNHVLKDADKDRIKNTTTYNNPNLPLSEGLIDVIVNFIKKEQ